MSRQDEPLTARLERDGDRLLLRSPGVGLWREQPTKGSVLVPGSGLGRLEVLGRLVPVLAPRQAQGVVIALGGDGERARRPVGYDDLLVEIDPEVGGAAALVEPSRRGAEAAADGSLLLTASSHGRYYARPAPDKPAFVKEGDVITRGQTVALLEVMKTFNRVTYGGPDLPEKARVLRVVADDGADLETGDVILELEEAD